MRGCCRCWIYTEANEMDWSNSRIRCRFRWRRHTDDQPIRFRYCLRPPIIFDTELFYIWALTISIGSGSYVPLPAFCTMTNFFVGFNSCKPYLTFTGTLIGKKRCWHINPKPYTLNPKPYTSGSRVSIPSPSTSMVVIRRAAKRHEGSKKTYTSNRNLSGLYENSKTRTPSDLHKHAQAPRNLGFRN